MNMQRALVRMIVCACALALAAAFAVRCDGGGSAPEPTPETGPGAIVVPAGQPIEIGVSAALSGGQSALGTDLADAAELAVRDFGRGILGRQVSVLRKDDRCTDAEAAESVAREFIASRTVAGVIGPMCTTGAQAANRLYAAAGVVHIAATVTRAELADLSDGYFFRVAWRDDAQPFVQAQFARQALQASTVAVVDDGEPYGLALAAEFAQQFTAAGGEVVSRDRVPRGTSDFGGIVRQIKAANPSIVAYQGLNPEGASFIAALRAEGYTGGFIGPDGLLNAGDFVFPTGGAAEGATITGGATPDAAFTERFAAAFGRAPGTPFVLQSYDAATLLLGAIEDVADENEAGDVVIDRVALAEAMRRREAVALTGDVKFDERGERTGNTPRALGLAVYRVAFGVFLRAD